MATLPFTELASRPGVRLHKLLRPIDRAGLSRLLPLGVVHRLMDPEYLNLCYHNVAEPVDVLTHYSYDCKRPTEFEQDLSMLSARFGIADAAPFADQAAPVPARRGQALISFDDGHRQWSELVLPILRRHQVSALMFVSSATIGNRYLLPAHAASVAIHLMLSEPEAMPCRLESAARLFGLDPGAAPERVCDAIRAAGSHEGQQQLHALVAEWGLDLGRWLAETRPYLDEGQIRELSAAGCVLGGHGIDHRSLHTAPLEEVERQVLESCAAIRDITGQRVVPFAFPYSRRVAEAPLVELRRREPWIGAYFGTGGLRSAPAGFQERIVADWRFSAGPKQRPDALLTLCKRAYLACLASRLR